MLTADCLDVLLEHLRASGAVPGADPGVAAAQVLEVFLRFAAVPVEDCAGEEHDGDMVLAQFGTHGFLGPETFRVGLTRQLIEATEDDDPEMTQVSCTLHWPPTPQTTALGSGAVWSNEVDDLPAAVRALPGFAWALGTSRPPSLLEVAATDPC